MNVFRHFRDEVVRALDRLAAAGTFSRGPRLHRLSDPAELALAKLLAGWPRLVESAAEAHESHRVAFYLYDAAAFHGLWNKGKDDPNLRFLMAADAALAAARLALLQATATIIASGLEIMGVEPVEEMR